MIQAMDQNETVNAEAFIQRWQAATGSELATAQTFVIELCELLGVERLANQPVLKNSAHLTGQTSLQLRSFIP